MRFPLILNSCLLLLILGSTALLDRSLYLGGFHGVVFGLYTAYASGALVVANLIWAVTLGFKDQKAQAKVVATIGIVAGIIGVVIGYVASRMFF